MEIDLQIKFKTSISRENMQYHYLPEWFQGRKYLINMIVRLHYFAKIADWKENLSFFLLKNNTNINWKKIIYIK